MKKNSNRYKNEDINTPFFSVILPCYNAEHHIAKAVRSIKMQSFEDYEVVIVDDGSTDGTKRIIKKLESTKIRVFSQKNKGVSSARNVGIREARGRYLLFLDADDEFCSGALSEIYKTVIEYGKPDIVRFGGMRQMPNGNYSKIKSIEELDLSYPKHKKEILEILLGSDRLDCYVPLLCMKNKNIKYFDASLKYLEDEMFYLENMTRIRSEILFRSQEIYRYNFNPKSKTKNLKNFLVNMEDIIRANTAKKEKLQKIEPDLIASQEKNAFQLILSRYQYFLQGTNGQTTDGELAEFSAIVNKNYRPKLLKSNPKLLIRIFLLSKNIHYLEKLITRVKKWRK